MPTVVVWTVEFSPKVQYDCSRKVADVADDEGSMWERYAHGGREGSLACCHNANPSVVKIEAQNSVTRRQYYAVHTHVPSQNM